MAHENHRRIVSSIVCAVLALIVSGGATARMAEVTATQAETAEAWRSYWQKADSWTPTSEFPYQSCFETAAAAHDVPLTLALALSRGESNFDPNAVSSAEAIGMMQILWPITARHLGIADKKKLYDPCINIEAGVRYLREMLDRYNNNVHLTLAAYNYGPGRIKPDDIRVPDGAAWYSGYIYNHLRYVLGNSTPQSQRQPPARYEDERRHTLITFNDPSRAAAFVQYLRDLAPSTRLDWFDGRLGRWTVDMLYQDEAEKAASTRSLKAAGLSVPEE